MLVLVPVILDSSIKYIYLFVSVQLELSVFNVNGHWYNDCEPIYRLTLWKEPGITVKGVYELIPHRLSVTRLLD